VTKKKKERKKETHINAEYVLPYQFGVTLLVKTQDMNNVLAQHWTCKVGNHSPLLGQSFTLGKGMTLGTEIPKTSCTEIQLLRHPAVISIFCKMYLWQQS
jgi:hypothetical protein